LFRELENEIIWKTIGISFYLLPQRNSFHPIQVSQVAVEHDLMAANQIDFLLDNLCGNGGLWAFRHCEEIILLIIVKLNIR